MDFYFDVFMIGLILGIGFACGVGIVMKISDWLDYWKHKD